MPTIHVLFGVPDEEGSKAASWRQAFEEEKARKAAALERARRWDLAGQGFIYISARDVRALRAHAFMI